MHARPPVGAFSWHELATSDYEGAFDFYSDLFGWHKNDAMDMGEHGIYQLYGRDEFEYGGMFNKTDEMPGPPAWLYYISVEDVNAAVERVKELGGQVLVGPMEVPDGDLIAQCLEPQGGPATPGLSLSQSPPDRSPRTTSSRWGGSGTSPCS